MSDIDIRRKHGLPLPKARQAAERVAKQLEREFDLEYRWEGYSLHFRRSGVDGRLTVSAEEVHLRASLGLLLSFLKPQIETKVHQHLDQALEPARNVTTKAAHRPAAKPPAKHPSKRRR